MSLRGTRMDKREENFLSVFADEEVEVLGEGERAERELGKLAASPGLPPESPQTPPCLLKALALPTWRRFVNDESGGWRGGSLFVRVPSPREWTLWHGVQTLRTRS